MWSEKKIRKLRAKGTKYFSEKPHQNSNKGSQQPTFVSPLFLLSLVKALESLRTP